MSTAAVAIPAMVGTKVPEVGAPVRVRSWTSLTPALLVTELVVGEPPPQVMVYAVLGCNLVKVNVSDPVPTEPSLAVVPRRTFIDR